MAKICLITSLYPPYHRGGTEVVVQKIIRGLVNDNHRLVLITLGRQNSRQQEGGLTIYRVKPFNLFSFIDIDKKPTWQRAIWHVADVFNFFQAAKVRKILAAEKPSAGKTHNPKNNSHFFSPTHQKI